MKRKPQIKSWYEVAAEERLKRHALESQLQRAREQIEILKQGNQKTRNELNRVVEMLKKAREALRIRRSDSEELLEERAKLKIELGAIDEQMRAKDLARLQAEQQLAQLYTDYKNAQLLISSQQHELEHIKSQHQAVLARAEKMVQHYVNVATSNF